MSIKKILIANRGEIAVRVITAARHLGYGSVAVFSDADRDALHVGLADEAVRIGAAAATDSYLNTGALLLAAQQSGADAVHPGYGFLSENAAFARACEAANLTFIGPPAAVIEIMGDKARAKREAERVAIASVPGYAGAEQSDAILQQQAAAVGYPLLVKAVAGGGGRGMRRVNAPAQLAAAIRSARRQAQAAFHDDRLMLERFVANGRHIEIQVFADNHGHVVHLGERDCTIQRRRQKVIEEAPASSIDERLRQRLTSAAVGLTSAIGYRGAGTIEFIVTPAGDHYFLEMNTRLQVEHAVTEMVTGIDLVAWQLRVADGEPLPLAQEQIAVGGHAIEARLYAEDPYCDFAPQTGEIVWFRPSKAAACPGVRIDTGVAQGDVITPHYDAMVAKFIAHGHNRETALRRLVAALRSTPLAGPSTNRPLLLALLQSEAFTNGDMTTSSLDEWAATNAGVFTRAGVSPRQWALAAAFFAAVDATWFRSSAPAKLEMTLVADEHRRTVTLLRGSSTASDAPPRVHIRGDGIDVSLHVLAKQPGWLHYQHHGVQRRAFALSHRGTLYLDDGDGITSFREPSPYPLLSQRGDPRRITAPVAGTLLRLDVQPGDAVAAGQTVAVIEAMKMETQVCAAAEGTVTAVHAAVGEQLEADALVMELALSGGAHATVKDNT